MYKNYRNHTNRLKHIYNTLSVGDITIDKKKGMIN